MSAVAPIAAVLQAYPRFSAVPIGRQLGQQSAISLISELLGQSFELTVRGVAPAVATLVISTFLVGFLARILPQLNLLQVGLASNLALMLIALILTAGGCVWLVIDNLEISLTMIRDVLENSAIPVVES